jgi:glycogen phosphorylase
LDADHGARRNSLLNTIRQTDYYLLTEDFDSCKPFISSLFSFQCSHRRLRLDIAALAMVDEAYQDKEEWIKKSIRTTAKMGKFSSDRSILEYAESFWNIEPVPVA